MNTVHGWLVLLAMLIVIFIANVDATAVNLALPQMTTSFGLKDWMVEWVINGYLISSACFFVIGGKLGDSFGKRRIFIIGLSIFILSSLLACFAISGWEIISARIIQGFSFALTYPMSIIILTQVFPKEKQGLVMALVVSASGFSIAAGPTVGGLLLYWLNWRAIFAINIPLGVIATLIVWLVAKNSYEPRDRQFKDIIGSLLLIGGLFYFIYTLNHLTEGVVNKIEHLIIPFVLLSCFFIYERRIPQPLLNNEIFSHSSYIFANSIRMLCQFIFIGLLFILPVTLQNIYTISSLKISVMLLPLTVCMGIGSIGVGKWISKVDPLFPVTLGCLVLLFACMWLSLMPAYLSISYLEIGLLMIGIAFALLFPGLNTIALTGHKSEISGQAFGVYYTNATLAGSVSIGISAEILKFFSQWRAKGFKTSELIPLASGLTPINFKNYTIDKLNLLYQGFHHGWVALFGFYAFLMLIALLFSLWKRRVLSFYR